MVYLTTTTTTTPFTHGWNICWLDGEYEGLCPTAMMARYRKNFTSHFFRIEDILGARA